MAPFKQFHLHFVNAWSVNWDNSKYTERTQQQRETPSTAGRNVYNLKDFYKTIHCWTKTSSMIIHENLWNVL